MRQAVSNPIWRLTHYRRGSADLHLKSGKFCRRTSWRPDQTASRVFCRRPGSRQRPCAQRDYPPSMVSAKARVLATNQRGPHAMSRPSSRCFRAQTRSTPLARRPHCLQSSASISHPLCWLRATDNLLRQWRGVITIDPLFKPQQSRRAERARLRQ